MSLKQRSVTSRLWLPVSLALALALALPALFAAVPTQAATVAGEFCIEGLVIDHEENPLADWEVTAQNGAGPITTTSADDDDDDFDEGEFEFEELTPEPYTVTLTMQEGWEAVTPDVIQVPLNEKVGADSCVKVRFKVRRIVRVEVLKVDQDLIGLEDWRILATPGKGNFFAEKQEETTDISGTAVFTLTPGLWLFEEMAPKEGKTSFMPFVPRNGKQELMISEDVGVSETLTLRFKNQITHDGCLIVDKFEGDPKGVDATGLVGWRIEVLRMDGEVAAVGYTDAHGRVKFDHLARGPYRIAEESRGGFEHTNFPVVDVNVTGGRDMDDGTPLCQEVVFENAQAPVGFCIEGRKIDVNGGYGIAGWEIDVTAVADGSDDLDMTVETNGLGEFFVEFPFDDYRVPGAQFKVCEEEKDGWVSNSPSCRLVTLPKHPGVCIDVGDFVNAQVGHKEAKKYEEKYEEKHKSKKDMYEDCAAMHHVKEGDQLYAVARYYKVEPQALVDANPKVRKDHNWWIYPGDKLCIPEKEMPKEKMPEYGPPAKEMHEGGKGGPQKPGGMDKGPQKPGGMDDGPKKPMGSEGPQKAGGKGMGK